MSTETTRLIRDGGGGGDRVWRWGEEREIIYLSLQCHLQNDSCINTGSDESHFDVSVIVRDNFTKQCPQITTLLLLLFLFLLLIPVLFPVEDRMLPKSGVETLSISLFFKRLTKVVLLTYCE